MNKGAMNKRLGMLVEIPFTAVQSQFVAAVSKSV